jgi:cell division protein FtsA
MLTNKAAVMQIGSTTITLVLQDAKHANNFLFKGSKKYAGFQDGEFLDDRSLIKTIQALVEECKEVSSVAIEEILVGIPAEFTAIACKTVEMSYNEPKALTPKELDEIDDKGNTYKNHHIFQALNASPIFYVCDDGQKMPDPIGVQCSRVTANLSYILMERSLGEKLSQIAESLNLKFTYASTTHAVATYVVPQEMRDKGVILLDAGAISSTLAYIKGDGIVHQGAFSVGGENIAADIHIVSEGEIPYDHATELLTKLNLNLAANPNEDYTVTVKGQAFPYPITKINEIAYYRILEIAETVQGIIKASKTPINPYTEILLTGSGLSSIVGAKDIIASVTNRRIKTISAELLQFNKPADAGVAALILMQQQKFPYKKTNEIVNIISKIKGLFKKR